MKDRNFGKFRLDSDLVKNHPRAVVEAFYLAEIVPVRCEMLFISNELEYTAISPRFAAIPPRGALPEYELKIHYGRTGNVELVEILPKEKI